MVNKWRALGVQGKLHILIQGSFLILFVISMQSLSSRFESQIISSAKARAVETADGLINGMNMLMLTGTISNPDNRRLLLKKMSESKGVHQLRIIRAKQVQDQFGTGLPEEQAVDAIDRKVIKTGKIEFASVNGAGGTPLLRVEVPFIAQDNFRGTNCLSCHHVRSGSVNGAASVVMDLSEETANISNIKRWLWLWFIAAQVVLSMIIALFVRTVISRHITHPVQKLQKTISSIHHDGDLSRQAEIDENNADIAEMAQAFNTLTTSLLAANKRLDLFAQVFNNSGEAILVTDADQNIITVNRAFTAITGYEAEEVIGRNPRLLSSGRQTPEFYQAMWKSINESGKWRGEIWNRRKNGDIYPELLSIGTVRDDQGQVANYIAIFIDITKNKETEQQIQFLAYYDSLTSLPNRRLFEDRVQQGLAAAKRKKMNAALLFIDLDRFKSINDSLGHLSGDQLLQSVAVRLKSCVRETDTVCRQGGDEFIILLPEIKRPEDAALIAINIITSMSDMHSINGHQLLTTVSIGISLFPNDGTDSLTLIKNADTAMYHAKEMGRNNFQFFTPNMSAEAAERLLLEADLRKAVRENEFMLHYQPQIDSNSGKISGIEALIRWWHPDKGWISPNRFIPVAEECGLISQIGEWVLNAACRQNKIWQQEKLLRVPVAVNVSALQFHQASFTESITKALAGSGLKPGYLELEITEGAAMKEFAYTVHTLQELEKIGVIVSIDDFGTGHSSLNYLKRFPISKLKVDQSFVRDIVTDADDAAIVQTIIRLGHNLHLKVIAEGVESAEQLDFLKNNGCDEIQGFYISKPLPANDFEKFVKSHELVGSGNRPQFLSDRDNHATDITEINRQHLNLLGLINKLNEAIKAGTPAEILARIIEEFSASAEFHFSAEERLMKQCDYPIRNEHRKEHNTLLAELRSIKDMFGNRIEIEMVQSIKKWLLSHIESSDQRLVRYIANTESHHLSSI